MRLESSNIRAEKIPSDNGLPLWIGWGRQAALLSCYRLPSACNYELLDDLVRDEKYGQTKDEFGNMRQVGKVIHGAAGDVVALFSKLLS